MLNKVEGKKYLIGKLITSSCLKKTLYQIKLCGIRLTKFVYI